MCDSSLSWTNPLTHIPSENISLMSHSWLGLDGIHCLSKTLQKFPLAVNSVQSLYPAHHVLHKKALPDSPNTHNPFLTFTQSVPVRKTFLLFLDSTNCSPPHSLPTGEVCSWSNPPYMSSPHSFYPYLFKDSFFLDAFSDTLV